LSVDVCEDTKNTSNPTPFTLLSPCIAISSNQHQSIKQASTTHLTTSAASRLNLKNITSSSPDIVSPIARGISPPFNLAANDDALFPKLWLELLLFVFVLRLSVVVFDMLREIEPKACLARSIKLVLLVFCREAIM
jgi:hypothetical protein